MRVLFLLLKALQWIHKLPMLYLVWVWPKVKMKTQMLVEIVKFVMLLEKMMVQMWLN